MLSIDCSNTHKINNTISSKDLNCGEITPELKDITNIVTRHLKTLPKTPVKGKRKFSHEKTPKTKTNRIIQKINFDNLKNILKNNSVSDNPNQIQRNSQNLIDELNKLKNHSEMQSKFEMIVEPLVLILIPYVKYDEVFDFLQTFLFPKLIDNDELRLMVIKQLWDQHPTKRLLGCIGTLLLSKEINEKSKNNPYLTVIITELLNSSLWVSMINNTKLLKPSLALQEASFPQPIHRFFTLVLIVPNGSQLLKDILLDKRSSDSNFNTILKNLADLAEHNKTNGVMLTAIARALPQSAESTEPFLSRISCEPDDFLRIIRLLPEKLVPPLPVKVLSDQESNENLRFASSLQLAGTPLRTLDCWEIVLSPAIGVYRFYQSLTSSERTKVLEVVLKTEVGENFCNHLTSECSSEEFVEIYFQLSITQRQQVLSWHLAGFRQSSLHYSDFDDSLFLRINNLKLEVYDKYHVQRDPATVQFNAREFTSFHPSYFRTDLFLTKAASFPLPSGKCIASSDQLQKDIVAALDFETLDDKLLMFTNGHFNNDRDNSFFNRVFQEMPIAELQKLLGLLFQRIKNRHLFQNKDLLNQLEHQQEVLGLFFNSLKKEKKELAKIQSHLLRAQELTMESDDDYSEEEIEIFEKSKLESIENSEALLVIIGESITNIEIKTKKAMAECNRLGQIVNNNWQRAASNQQELLYKLLFHASEKTAQRVIETCETFSAEPVSDGEVSPEIQFTIGLKLLLLKTFLDFLFTCTPHTSLRNKSLSSPLQTFQLYEKIDQCFLLKLTPETRNSLLELVAKYDRFKPFCAWRNAHHAKVSDKVISISTFLEVILKSDKVERIIFAENDDLTVFYEELSAYFITDAIRDPLMQKLKSSSVEGVKCFAAWLDKKVGYSSNS